MSRDTLRQLRLRGVLTPGKHYRRWGCTQGWDPLHWHLENVEATITGGAGEFCTLEIHYSGEAIENSPIHGCMASGDRVRQGLGLIVL